MKPSTSFTHFKRQPLLTLGVLAALQLALDGTAAGANAAQAALPVYSAQFFATLPTPAGVHATPLLQSLNNWGQAAGQTTVFDSVTNPTYATLWRADGPARNLTPANAAYGFASGINDGGLVAGTLSVGSQSIAVRWTADGQVQNLGQAAGVTQSQATAINTIWQVSGSAFLDGRLTAALWQADGSFTPVGHLSRVGDPSLFSSARDLNDQGTVVGVTSFATGDTQAWRWSPVTGLQALPKAAPGSDDTANAVNDAGWVVGQTQGSDLLADPMRALAWNPQGQIVELQGGGFTHTRALDVAPGGLIVGEGDLNGWSQGWVWSPESGMVSLSSRVLGVPGLRVGSASAINALGQIAGWAVNDLTGESGLVLLTPTAAVPEPGPALLLAAGLAGLAWRRRGRA